MRFTMSLVMVLAVIGCFLVEARPGRAFPDKAGYSKTVVLQTVVVPQEKQEFPASVLIVAGSLFLSCRIATRIWERKE